MSIDPTHHQPSQGSAPQPGELIANRFRIEGVLGRGGMGWVLRARDEAKDEVVALKQLDLTANPKYARQLMEQFEREFHALSDLTHPRVVEVFDYGVWNGVPFYTLELLDGGDVHTLAPLPWQDVCSIAYDICSALSLLHSRRLLHRDITPRNIRRTVDGKAKLLDFGLLSPMGSTGVVAGTPPFVAPELVQRHSLDARSDLFSLGCTLYYALTGRVGFPARSFAELQEFWGASPLPPSNVVPEIPSAVDELVIALARIDVSLRPKTAAEVMDRLRPLLRDPPDEELDAARSYLSTPQLFGREETIATFRAQLSRPRRERGAGFLILGEGGVGRSRMIDAFVLEAKVIGATALRANAVDGGTGPFGVARALAEDLLVAQPASAEHALRSDADTFGVLFRATPQKLELHLEHDRAEADRAALQTALRAWFLQVAQDYPLAIAVDDVDRIDEPSAALLATLSWEAPRCGLVYACSANARTPRDHSHALAVLYEHAIALPLRPLTDGEMYALLASVFGDVPNLRLLSTRLFELSGGNPRDAMELAQHLVDEQTVRYADGNWTLPAELMSGMLPDHMEEALERRIAAQHPLAQRLVVLLALSVLERLSRSHLLHLDGVTSAEIDRALDELRVSRIVTGTSAGYALSQAHVARQLVARLSPDELARAHRELAALLEAAGECSFAVLHHMCHGDQPGAVTAQMVEIVADPQRRIRETDRAEAELGTDRAMRAFICILEEAERLGRPPAELQIWRAMLAGMCARGGDATQYYRVSGAWLAQLQQDSGYDDWHALGDTLAPADRITQALARAAARHAELPPERRGAAPGDAIKGLVGYVVMSIAVSVRLLDLEVQRSLPPLLEPFAPLSPLVEAMLWNARATCLNGIGKREEARALFVQVLEQIAMLDGSQLAYLDKVRAAIQQTVTEIDASLGVHSEYIDRLEEPDRDPNHRVGAHYIKKVAALNAGDLDAAERHRRDAELLSLQNKASSMFSTLGQELEAHALARDLRGVKQVRTGVSAMARHYPGWIPVLRVADAHYFRLCRDLTAALRAAGSLRALPAAQRASPWCIQANAIEAELLVELGRPLEAYELAEPVRVACAREQMRFLARSLDRALTLAEVALGRFDAALARIERVIAELRELGVSGVQLHRAYECAARIALSADAPAIKDRASELANHSPAAYHWLEGLSGRRVLDALARRDPIAPSVSSEIQSRVAGVMHAVTPRERAQKALELLCEIGQSSEGYLYLVSATDLELAAAVRGNDSEASLEQFARSWFASRSASDSELLTVAETQVTHEIEPAPDTWISDSGVEFVITLLRTPSGGTLRTVGMALLRRGARNHAADLAPLATAVAAYLTFGSEG